MIDNMISLDIIILLLVLHYWGDFILQSSNMALNKSHCNYWLTFHAFVYSLPFLSFLNFYFWLYIFITHWIVDYFTSRLNARLWKKTDKHFFWLAVGFDQFLHYTFIFCGYKWIVL
jgi:uncharacterized protein DUF3307